MRGDWQAGRAGYARPARGRGPRTGGPLASIFVSVTRAEAMMIGVAAMVDVDGAAIAAALAAVVGVRGVIGGSPGVCDNIARRGELIRPRGRADRHGGECRDRGGNQDCFLHRSILIRSPPRRSRWLDKIAFAVSA